jgi:PAS domain S-box-containing protein
VHTDLATTALLDLLFDEAAVGRCLVAPDGAVLRANAEWARALGSSVEAVVRATLVEPFPGVVDVAAALYARARAGQRVEVPRHPRRLDGRDTWWEGSIAPVPMAGGTGLLLTARQVGGPAPGDGAEHGGDPRQILHAISDASEDVIFAKDREGRIRFVNPAARALIGKPLDRVIGRTDAELLDDPEAARQVMENDRRIMASGVAEDLEERVPLPDGTERIWLSRKSPYRDATGNVIGLLGISRDITERKRAEEALRESEAALDAFFAGSPGILNLNDEELRYLKTDPTTPTYFGLTRETIVGKALAELAPEFVERFGPMLRRVVATGEPQLNLDVHSPVTGRPGETTYWRASYFPVPLRGGRRGLGVMGVEITDLRKAEAALGVAHERLRIHVETTPLGLVEWDSEYRVTRFSRRAEQLFGWTAEEVLGRRIDEVPWVPEEDWPSVRAVMRDMSSGARPANVNANRNLRKDGSVIHCEWYNSSVHDDAGRLVSVLSLVLDVTAAKRAEEALREEEKRYRSLFENSLDAVYLTRRDGTILDANRAACRMHGMTLEEIRQRGRSGLVVNDERHAAALKARAMTGQVRAEMTDLRKDGTRFPVEVESVIVDPTRPDGAAFVIARDITERKLAEERLLAANARLVEADRRKDEFLAMLSHELRNPLAPIRNGIYLLERAEPGSDEAARARDVIRRQAEHLTRLVDDLLDVTRISRGKVSLRRTRVDLRDVLRSATDDLRPDFARAGVVLDVAGPPAPVWADADPTRIAQVIGNMLQNAVKFTPAGGTVTVTLVARGDRAELRVRDTGVGMDPEKIEGMFEPFAQADETLARTKGGLGLGLALVKSLVELHGGSVEARSEGVGRGAEFLVLLPLAGSEAGPGSAQAADADPADARRVVLVVEDNVDAGRSLADVLELLGHRVVLAHDGRSGVELARELRPDVVLCDIGLPDLDGYELARTLRRDEALRGTRLVALSGYARPEDRQRARDAGFDAHVAKPPGLDELLRVIAQDG